MDAYMGTREAAELWGGKQSDVSKWCREGKLKGGMEVCEQDAPGKPWRIRRDAVPPTND